MATAHIPSSRPIIADSMVRNERLVRAALHAALADAQSYSYANDLRYAAADSAWANNGFDSYGSSCQTSQPGGVRPRNWTSVTGLNQTGVDDETKLYLCRIPVPPPLGPNQKLVVTIYAHISGLTAQATLDFVSDTYGTYTRATVTNAALGSPGANVLGSMVVNVPAVGGDTISVIGTYLAGGSEKLYIDGICAHWQPFDGLVAGATVDATWGSTLSQAFLAADQGYHEYIIHWLQRKGLMLASHRPDVVFTKWFAGHTSPSTTLFSWFDRTTVTRDLTVGKYAVYVGQHCNAIAVRLLCKAYTTGTATFNVKVYWKGSLVSTTAVSSAGGSVASYAWVSPADISVSSADQATVQELRIDTSITVTSGTNTLKVATVSAWEVAPTAGQIGLPGAETIPATFTSVDARKIQPNVPILFDTTQNGQRLGLESLIKGMIYLAGNRMRHLVNDCRYMDVGPGNGKSDLDSADGKVQRIYKFRTGPDTTNVLAWLEGRFMWWGGSSSANTGWIRTTCLINGATYSMPVTGSTPKSKTAGFGLATTRFGLAVSPNTEYEVRFGVNQDPLSLGSAPFWVCGAAIEEVPLTEFQMVNL